MRSRKIAIKLPVHMVAYIDSIAKQKGVSRSDAIRYITGLQLTRNENSEIVDKSNRGRGTNDDSMRE